MPKKDHDTKGGAGTGAGTENKPTTPADDQTPAMDRPGTDYEAAYKGLQPKYEALVKKHNDLERQLTELTGAKSDLESLLNTERAGWDAERKQAKAQLDELVSKASQYEEELTDLKLQLQKVDVIKKTDPRLLEVEHLIPVYDEAEAQEKAVGEFKALVDQLVAEAVKEHNERMKAGVTPPVTPPKPTPQSEQDIIEAMMKAASDGNDEAYSKLERTLQEVRKK